MLFRFPLARLSIVSDEFGGTDVFSISDILFKFDLDAPILLLPFSFPSRASLSCLASLSRSLRLGRSITHIVVMSSTLSYIALLGLIALVQVPRYAHAQSTILLRSQGACRCSVALHHIPGNTRGSKCH